MSGFYSGQDGQLYVNDNKVAKVRSWSLTVNQAILETVSLEDTDRTLLPGLRSVSGGCSLYYYQETAGNGTPTGGITTLLSNMITANSGSGGEQGGGTNSTVKFKLKVDDGTTNGRYAEFYAYLTSLSMTSATGEVLAADVSFEVHGAVTGLAL
tara:strand:+ start:2946 stop:3407 length:462 start_codon:yes stop_codon:yes gene_type:complete